jgi:hypothetical protein
MLNVKQFLNPTGSRIDSILIQANNPIMLTSDLNLAALIFAFNASILTNPFIRANVLLKFTGINGIEVAQWPNIGITINGLEFDKSKIEFYINGTLSSDLKCSSGLPDANFFPMFYTLTFNEGNTYPSQPVCPLIFRNANMDSFTLNDQTVNSSITNLWRFHPYQSSETAINSNIICFEVRGYNYNIDASMMHPLVFAGVSALYIYGTVSSIQTDLFQHFNQVIQIIFTLDNYKNFFHTVGIGWSTHLSTVNGPRIIFDADTLGDLSQYTYPDSDLCLFAQYPHQTALTYALNTNLTKCTSTIKWLTANYAGQDMSLVFSCWPNSKIIYSICVNSSINDTINFQNVTHECAANESRTTTASTTTKRTSTASMYYENGATTVIAEEVYARVIISMSGLLSVLLLIEEQK